MAALRGFEVRPHWRHGAQTRVGAGDFTDAAGDLARELGSRAVARVVENENVGHGLLRENNATCGSGTFRSCRCR